MELYKSKYSNKKKPRRNYKGIDESSRSFRNSRDDGNGESATVTCADCGTECQIPFVPRTDRPVYCSDCFRKNKPRDSESYRDDRSSRYSRDDRSSRYSRDDRSSRYSRDDGNGESATVTCADCGTECQIPFVPRTDRPVYCSDCFRKNKPRDSESYRDDRSSKSFHPRESNGNESRSKKPRNDKFLKKQERFYSNGSDKFYAGIKEKLFEILGGKICSSCGFKDERALGISYIFGDDSSENPRRGNVSLMGKYISEPDLARKELKVLCLNCNELREIISKPKENHSKHKQKKSRFFPR